MGLGTEGDIGEFGASTMSIVKVDCCWGCPLGYAAQSQVYSTGLLLVGSVEEVADNLATDDVYAADDHSDQKSCSVEKVEYHRLCS